MEVFVLLMVTSLGVMGIITPYGTGPSPIYYGSGYLPTKDYWRLGTIFGAIFLAAPAADWLSVDVHDVLIPDRRATSPAVLFFWSNTLCQTNRFTTRTPSLSHTTIPNTIC
ncbi:anion permease [Enterobacter ludwigii]